MKQLIHDIKDPEEKLFIKMILEYATKSTFQNRTFFTHFYYLEWMKSVIQKHLGMNSLGDYAFFGGYEYAQRQMIGFGSSYQDSIELPISCLKIIVKTGLGKSLSHRDFLGSLLGLGLERDMIGDIILRSFGAYVIIKKNVMDYITYNLVSIGRYHHIEILEVDFSEIEFESPQTKSINTTVACLRADAIASAGFGISRTICTKLIQNDKAKCNGISVTPQHLLKEGDVMTLRGYGKIKLKQINGFTKKERVHICIEKYI